MGTPQFPTPNEPQQPTQPTYYPTPPKSKHTMRNIGIGCGAVAAAAVALIVILVVVMAASSGGATTTTTTTTSNTSGGGAPTTAPTTAPAKVAHVGDTITVDGVATTLVSVAKVTQGQYDTPPAAGDSYYALKVSVTNHSSNTVAYNELDFNVYNGQGATTDTPFITSIASNASLNSGNLAAGGTVSGLLLAELPTKDAGAKLVWNPSFFDNSTNNAWNLGL